MLEWSFRALGGVREKRGQVKRGDRPFYVDEEEPGGGSPVPKMLLFFYVGAGKHHDTIEERYSKNWRTGIEGLGDGGSCCTESEEESKCCHCYPASEFGNIVVACCTAHYILCLIKPLLRLAM